MALSSMMKHWSEVKKKYEDCIVFYRLGDFYEMFFDDAKLVSKELNLTLTGRECGLEERAPMCGVPAKAVDTYVAKLVNNNHKIAICEQLTEPEKGKMVERDVIRVITAGTLIEDSLLVNSDNNYIFAMIKVGDEIGLSWCDISTGEFYVSSVKEENEVLEILSAVKPSEVLLNENIREQFETGVAVDLGLIKNIGISSYFLDMDVDKYTLQEFFSQSEIEKLKNNSTLYGGAVMLLTYLKETQKRTLLNINRINVYTHSKYMLLDVYTRRNLELTETMRDKAKRGSIWWLLDQTKTAMGARQLKQIINEPLRDENLINQRLDAVEELTKNIIVRDKLSEILYRINDIERVSTRLIYGSVMPNELISLKNSLKVLPKLKDTLKELKSHILNFVFNNIEDFSAEIDLIERALIEGENKTVLKDGGFIKTGYDNLLDEYRRAKSEGKLWLTRLEETEKEETNIKNLKVVFARNFGYCIEVTKSQLDLVPYRYQRRQTLTNCERYVTEELREIEDKILGSEEKGIKRELDLYTDLKEKLTLSLPKFQKISSLIGLLDSMFSLSVVAIKYNYVRPKINSKIHHIKIEGGRHPIVEVINKNEMFVDNDTLLDEKQNRTMIITGPNMAGKSTYMRQVAVITFLAHIGSFVPARSAEISLVDRIFTRIGASDDLAFGQSTFMVEMSEVSNILNNATNKSLVLLDEVGRGTSTFDGMSIAYGVIEYMDSVIKCKTLFSTHYHELTELEGKLEGVKNYRVNAKEYGDNVIFLRKVVRGSASKSFGIYVAEKAGIPKPVISRSKEILRELENSEISLGNNIQEEDKVESNRNSLEIVNRIKEVDINKISPIEAMMFLSSLKKSVE